MKTHSEYDCMIPDYAICYLVNNDSTGMENSDIEATDNYMEQFYNEAKECGGHVLISPSDEESYFTHSPDFGLACNVIDTKIIILAD